MVTDSDLQTHHPAILVVEHNRFLRDLICDWLGAAGYIAHAAGDIRSAIAWLDRRRFDLVLIDVHLPRREGISLIRSVESKLLGTPMVLLTGVDSYDDVLASVPAEVPCVKVAKPYSFFGLGLVLEAVLAGSRANGGGGSGASDATCR